MPLRPEDLDFMQSYLNGAPREELQGRLDSMYGQPTPDQMQAAFGGPDARTAQNMSSEPTMSSAEGLQNTPAPAPAPVASDAGMSMPQPTGPVASEAPAMSTVSPEQLASMGQQAQANLAASAAAPEAGESAVAAPGAEQTPEQRAFQRYLLGGGRPQGAYQPGGEQFAERSISRELRSPMSPETADELEAANIDAQGLAVGQGESSASMLEKQAALQAQQAQDARTQLASYQRNVASKQAEYDMQRSQLDDMRQQIQREPMTFWSGKDTGTQIMNGIGLFLLGLGGGPEIVQRVIERDIATKEKERGAQISLLQDQLNRFKEGIPSPESQALYTRSLGLDAAAAEAERMASIAKAEDARQRGFSLAEQLRLQALQARAAAESAPLGKEEIKTKNVPGKYVGGGKSQEEQILERYKKAGGTGGPVEAFAWAIHGQPSQGTGEPTTPQEIEKAKYFRETAVRLPNGELAHATDKEKAHELQQQINAADSIRAAYDKLAKIRQQVGPSGQWNRELLGEANAAVSSIKLNIRGLEKNSGGSIRLSEGSENVMGPLSGEGIKDWLVGEQFDGALKGSREFVNDAQDKAINQLSKSTWGMDYVSTPAGGKGSTFKPHAAPKGKE